MHSIIEVGSVYLAQSAVLVGDVELGDGCNIWHHCSIRGDVGPVRLGQRVNVQDGAILHCKYEVPLEIDDEVVIGHGAVVHCRRVGRHSLIGIRATLLDDCEVGEGSIIAAGTVVTPGTMVPPGSVVMGAPGRVVRAVTADEQQYIATIVQRYRELAEKHAASGFAPYHARFQRTPGAR